MKTIFFSFLLILLASCQKNDNTHNQSCVDIEYNESFNLEIGSSACLSDGRMIKLLSVEDQFCPCDIYCDWSGELLLSLELTEIDGTEKTTPLSAFNREVFDDFVSEVSLTTYTYIYDGETNNLPLCQGIFDQEKITMVFTLTE